MIACFVTGWSALGGDREPTPGLWWDAADRQRGLGVLVDPHMKIDGGTPCVAARGSLAAMWQQQQGEFLNGGQK